MQPSCLLSCGPRAFNVIRPGVARRTPCVVASTKGFGSGEEAKPASSVKVNERGKQSSRMGPASQKQIKQQMKQQQQLAETPAVSEASPTPQAASTPASTPASPAARTPIASSPSRASASDRNSNLASTPQVVVDRMFIRMITCAALPVITGLILLVVFYYLKEAQGDDFPMWIVYVSQNLLFGGGLLGITYGIMSTSWDPTREGSMLGWDEFRANLPVVLNRGK